MVVTDGADRLKDGAKVILANAAAAADAGGNAAGAKGQKPAAGEPSQRPHRRRNTE
jgi:hypothetical protein